MSSRMNLAPFSASTAASRSARMESRSVSRVAHCTFNSEFSARLEVNNVNMTLALGARRCLRCVVCHCECGVEQLEPGTIFTWSLELKPVPTIVILDTALGIATHQVARGWSCNPLFTRLASQALLFKRVNHRAATATGIMGFNSE